jgi:hypothetical protein
VWTPSTGRVTDRTEALALGAVRASNMQAQKMRAVGYVTSATSSYVAGWKSSQ